MTTRQIVLASRPKGSPTLDNFRFENFDLPEMKDDSILLKGIFYSVDPYMRGRMNDEKSYIPPFEINQPITGGVVGVVSESKSTNFKTGDMVIGMLPWREQIVTSEKSLKKIDASIAPASSYLGILGMTGLTAYFGLMKIGKPKAGETVVVSGAAGAVGSVVGQIAKLQGCRVIGIAGSAEKIKILKEDFGFDEVINYKTTHDITSAIASACPKGVDVYFDNVGGDISDAVLKNINFQARIPICGQISTYNSIEIPTGPRVQTILVKKSALMQGFIVGDFQSQFTEGIRQLSEWVKEGKLKYTETIEHGFDKLPAAFLDLFAGKNTGKMMVGAQ